MTETLGKTWQSRPVRSGAKRSASRRRTATAETLLDVVCDLSSKFANVAPDRTDHEARAALRRIVEYFDLDRCTLYGLTASGNFAVIHRIHRDRSRMLHELSDARAQFPWTFEQVVGRRRTISFNSLDELPAAASSDKESFGRCGTRSALLIPVVAAGAVQHVVAFASVRHPHRWDVSPVRCLRLLAETVVRAIRLRADADARLEAQRFERLVFDLSSGFAGAFREEIDDKIALALDRLLAFTGVDQCGFFTVFPESGESQLCYVASRNVTVPVGTMTQWSSVVPWLYQKVVDRKEAFSFTRRDELPPEAATDRKYLEFRRTRSALYVPYVVDGAVRYLLAVVSNSAERDWPEHVVERLKVLGTVFISALNRKALMDAQIQAQNRLAAAQRFARAELDALNEYVAVVDVTGAVVETSGQWRTLADGDGGSAEGVPVGGNYVAACESMEGSHSEAAVRLAQGIRSVLRGEADTFAMESARLLRGGLKWIHSTVRRFVVDGETYATISHEDVTSRRKSEQELQDLRASQWHSERITQTGVLIASIAHEISQPLMAILSNAQAGMRFIARDALDPQEMREILSDIVADDKRAAEIIESLRIMLRRQKTGRELVDIAHVLHDVIRLLHSEFIRRQVVVEHVCDPDCLVRANRSQIQQVALNLMVNGIEAMDQVPVGRRRLRVEVRRLANDKIRLGVRDSGVGIAPEALDKVFDAFWTTKSSGTGMGLAVGHSIIEAHGGRIWIDRNDDAGCTFFVELPAAMPAEHRATTADVDAVHPAASPH
jgi:two-component system, LuxR family, sensor kinase FixL